MNNLEVVDKFNKGARSLATGDDIREETFIMNVGNANWGELIMPAPLSISLLAQLMLISTKADFKLETPEKGLEYVKYSNSFRASLVQVSNSGWEAFNQAHSSMLQISQYSANVPIKVKNAVSCLIQGSASDVSTQLPKILKSIMDTADECTRLAKGVEDKFEFVIKLTSELQEVCTLTKGTVEQKQQDTEAKKAAMEVLQKEAAEEKERASKLYTEMEDSLKAARRNFEDAANSQPSGWDLIGMNLVEGLSNAVVNVVNFGAPRKKSKKIKGNKDTPANATADRLDTALANGEILTSVITSLKTFANGGKLDAEQIRKSPNGPEFVKTLLNSFSQQSQGSSHAPTVADLCTTGIEIADMLKNLTGNLNPDNKQLAEQVTKIEQWCSKAQEFTATAKLATGQISRAGGIAIPTGPPPAAPNNVVQATVQNWQFKVQETRMVLTDTRASFEKSCDEQRAASKRLAELISEISAINIQEISFEQIRKVLTQGIKALAELKVQWGKLVQFFQQVSTVIKVAMNDSVKAFTNSVQTGHEQVLGGVTLSQYLKNTIYQEAMQASKVAYHVNLISTVYVDISRNFLMDRIASLGKLVALDPETDKNEIAQVKAQIAQGCTEAQNAISARVEISQREHSELVERRLNKIEQTLKSVLPPEEPKQIQQTNQILEGVKGKHNQEKVETRYEYATEDMA